MIRIPRNSSWDWECQRQLSATTAIFIRARRHTGFVSRDKPVLNPVEGAAGRSRRERPCRKRSAYSGLPSFSLPSSANRCQSGQNLPRRRAALLYKRGAREDFTASAAVYECHVFRLRLRTLALSWLLFSHRFSLAREEAILYCTEQDIQR
jgi:hypothetical protein